MLTLPPGKRGRIHRRERRDRRVPQKGVGIPCDGTAFPGSLRFMVAEGSNQKDRGWQGRTRILVRRRPLRAAGLHPSSRERAGVILHPTLETSADRVAQLEDAGIGDAIEDAGTFAATADDPGLGEGLEMSGGVGLGEAGGLDELGHVEFAGAKALEEAEARGFTEDPESGGDEFEGLIGEGGVRLGHGAKKVQEAACVNTYACILIDRMKTEMIIRILAGSLVLTGIVLSRTVHPNWIILAAFVGANLIQSAFTGFCPAEMIVSRLRGGQGSSGGGGCCSGGGCGSKDTSH